MQRRLSNGIRFNYWRTDNEPGAALMRVVAAGGRAGEGTAAGPSGVGAISVGTRTLSESGTVGPWRREQVELFCISRLLNCIVENDEEFVFMDCSFAVGELLHAAGRVRDPSTGRRALQGAFEMLGGVFASEQNVPPAEVGSRARRERGPHRDARAGAQLFGDAAMGRERDGARQADVRQPLQVPLQKPGARLS